MSNERTHGWLYSSENDRVWHSKKDGCGPVIRHKDGEYSSIVLSARNKLNQARGELWSILGPVEYDGMEIRQYAKLWHTEREEWLRAVRINVGIECIPYVTFTIDGSAPRTSLTYNGNRLAELREEGILETQKEVNDRCESLLNELAAPDEQTDESASEH